MNDLIYRGIRHHRQDPTLFLPRAHPKRFIYRGARYLAGSDRHPEVCGRGGDMRYRGVPYEASARVARA